MIVAASKITVMVTSMGASSALSATVTGIAKLVSGTAKVLNSLNQIQAQWHGSFSQLVYVYENEKTRAIHVQKALKVS